jgi:CubicO group peptidase (beta-lactamase class C family)
VTAETMFQSGSVGKQFTSAAVMLQVEDGKLALNDSIAKYFKDAPASWRSITVRHLLTHTSGIPDYAVDAFDYRKDYTEDELVKMAYALKLDFEPGSRWSYSNTGYLLLGALIRKVSGEFYGDVLKKRVFSPLGMKTARVISEEDIVPNRAAGYRLVEGQLKNQEWVAPTLNTTADGALYLNLLDYIAWDRALRAKTLLRPESWAQVYTPVSLNSGKTYPYGFGWNVGESSGQPWYQHGGSWQGFRTGISRYLGDDLTIVVLTNLAEATPSRFIDGIVMIFDPQASKIIPNSPLADQEPAVTERVRRLLASAKDGKLSPDEFADVSAGFFPDSAKYLAELLGPLGTPTRLELLDRRELGDDRVYQYAARYGERTYRVRLALAPDGKISEFGVQPE